MMMMLILMGDEGDKHDDDDDDDLDKISRVASGWVIETLSALEGLWVVAWGVNFPTEEPKDSA